MSFTHASATSDLSVSKLFDFSNHVVLVTGGSTGLGEMAAQGFIQNGARVFIASRKESELQKTAERLNKLGPGKCEYIVADLKDKAGCLKLTDDLKKRTERLTVLVNNSGATWGAPWDDFPESGWDKLMALNVKSIFYVTVGCHELLKKGATALNPSRVINIASMAGVQTTDVTTGESGGLSKPGDGTFSYGPSKAACIHLTRIQASKMMPDHITVNVICPGVFPSRMTNYGLGNFSSIFAAGQPSGRIGVPSDFAGTVLFLSSVASAHMTGNVLELDGGSTRSGLRGKAQSQSSQKL